MVVPPVGVRAAPASQQSQPCAITLHPPLRWRPLQVPSTSEKLPSSKRRRASSSRGSQACGGSLCCAAHLCARMTHEMHTASRSASDIILLTRRAGRRNPRGGSRSSRACGSRRRTSHALLWRRARTERRRRLCITLPQTRASCMRRCRRDAVAVLAAAITTTSTDTRRWRGAWSSRWRLRCQLNVVWQPPCALPAFDALKTGWKLKELLPLAGRSCDWHLDHRRFKAACAHFA